MTRYEPTFESLHSHPVPEWFQDAKLGIMISWGLYSVPGWAPIDPKVLDVLHAAGEGRVSEHIPELAQDPNVMGRSSYSEWYMNSAAIEGAPTAIHHAQVWDDRPYETFAEDFSRAVDSWDPEPWAELCRRSGSGYVVPLTKHHDGFLLWPSRTPNPFRERWQVTRDVIGELGNAVRAQDMRYALYYSGGLDWTFGGLPIRTVADMQPAIPQSSDYAAYVDAHWRELIERYEPAILWNDIGCPKESGAYELFADYYERFPEGAVNDRFSVEHRDFRTPEYQRTPEAASDKWELVRGLGYSFGYNQQETDEHLLSVPELVHLLVDVVSKNGNLLIGIGPTGTGEIPELQASRLKGLGDWLAVHGGAMYGTRPWRRAEGRTADDLPVRYTAKDGSLHVIVLGTPRGRELVVTGLEPAPEATIETPEGDSMPWEPNPEGVLIKTGGLPDAPAHSFRISPSPAG